MGSRTPIQELEKAPLLPNGRRDSYGSSVGSLHQHHRGGGGSRPGSRVSGTGSRRGSQPGMGSTMAQRSRVERRDSTLYIEGSDVSFHDVYYNVTVGQRCCCGGYQKAILENCNGYFKAGSMNAIMGPTGSGKSSLLDILAARKDPQGLSGTVLIDGGPQPPNFKLMSGYVVQDDVVMGTLTVRENFMFSAALRLPMSVSKAERKERVNNVIVELNLEKCADTKVGNAFIRGVSGGERKRTNIGMELIIAPNVLFLDEPTTGLDASTANSVMKLLQKLARNGSTIIFSIHQPRFSIFKLVENLVLLGNGEVMYFGPSDEGLEYYKSIGYECEERNNPADFFLDVINGDIAQIGPNALENGVDGDQRPEGADLTTVEISTADGLDSEGPTKSRTRKMASLFKASDWYQQCMQELKHFLTDSADSQRMIETSKRNRNITGLQYQSSVFRQFEVLSVRTVKNLVRNPRTSFMQLFVTMVFAVVTGAIYFGIDKSCNNGIQNRVGAFFFVIMNQIFGNLSAVDLFIQERTIFIHENVSGFYRVSTYFLSKVCCDIIPYRLIPVCFFCVIVYWMVGFENEPDKFFYFLLNICLTSFASCGLAFFISSCVRQPPIANLLIALSFVMMMLFGGLLINVESLAEWIQWLKYLSIFRWSLQALSISEMKDMVFKNASGIAACASGNEYLVAQGIPFENAFDLWIPQIALSGIFVGFLFLTYLSLVFMKKLK